MRRLILVLRHSASITDCVDFSPGPAPTQLSRERSWESRPQECIPILELNRQAICSSIATNCSLSAGTIALYSCSKCNLKASAEWRLQISSAVIVRRPAISWEPDAVPSRARISPARVAAYDVLLRVETHDSYAAELLDRKSTRLNSSHPSISYAVFCLKKKKKN